MTATYILFVISWIFAFLYSIFTFVYHYKYEQNGNFFMGGLISGAIVGIFFTVMMSIDLSYVLLTPNINDVPAIIFYIGSMLLMDIGIVIFIILLKVDKNHALRN